MRFLLDESADFPLAAVLKSLGHDATSIVHDHPRAIEDADVLAIALLEDRILITNDRDFGELVFRQRLPNAGVILLRMSDEQLALKAERLAYVIANYRDQLNQFIVITPYRIRVRQLTTG